MPVAALVEVEKFNEEAKHVDWDNLVPDRLVFTTQVEKRFLVKTEISYLHAGCVSSTDTSLK